MGDMFVKNPKYYFGYHEISKLSNNNQNLRFSKNHNSKKNVSNPKINNQNLRFSKKQNSKIKTQNTSSIARAIHSERNASRLYSQENLRSGGTIKDRRIPVRPFKGPSGGQAACKHPRDSQVGAHNTGSLNKLKCTPTI